MRRAAAVAAVALAAGVGACSGSDAVTPTTLAPVTTSTTVGPGSTSTTSTTAAPSLGSVKLATEEIAKLEAPVAFASRSSSNNLYVAQQSGEVRVIKVTRTQATSTTKEKVTYELQTTPILDLSDDLIYEGERGLLGLTFSTDGRRMYVDYTAKPDGRTVVAEYELGDRTTPDLTSRRELLTVPQPYANHNGGNLVFGPDGYLYIGLGDGGSGGDPQKHAQNARDLLGSILRIDPEGGTEDGPAYSIPAGNPFAGGKLGAPETWLYGVRNPWRFTFDKATGDLWIGDVGQDHWEEVDWLHSAGGFDAGRGANLGWNKMEGTHRFSGANPVGAVLPVYEYSHDEGCSIIGGYVYRGDAIPALRGAYLFGDYCAGGIRALQVAEGAVADHRDFDLPVEKLQSFGQDEDGELFLLLQGGQLLKVVPG